MKRYTVKELVTSPEKTRDGFITFALEKGRRASPIINEAIALRIAASRARTASDLLKFQDIRAGILTAAGLSDKSLKYFTEEDKNIAIRELIKNFLEPAGADFLDELVYRYLIVKGDALGGLMRNLIGRFAKARVVRSILSAFTIRGIDYQWTDKSFSWKKMIDDKIKIEENSIALSWSFENQSRILLFDSKLPNVNKNVDMILFNDASPSKFKNKKSLVKETDRVLMCGELKGGIDPAGADEHWKTARSALERIQEAFQGKHIALSFIGAAIENSMAKEIVSLLKKGDLSFASNLTNDKQLTDFTTWILDL